MRCECNASLSFVAHDKFTPQSEYGGCDAGEKSQLRLSVFHVHSTYTVATLEVANALIYIAVNDDLSNRGTQVY